MLGLRGLKLHPTAQGFVPDDRAGLPVCGKPRRAAASPCRCTPARPGWARACPVAAELKLEPSRPIHLDAVAADFPDLQIVDGAPAWPWQDEQLAVALHKPNTWIDLSGWSPRRFSPDLVRNIPGRCRTACCSGPTTRSCPTSSGSRVGDARHPRRRHRACLRGNAKRLLGSARLVALATGGGQRLARRPCASPRTRRRRAPVASRRRGVGEAVERDPRRAAAVRVVPGDRRSAREPVHAEHEHPQRIALLPLEPRLRVLVGPDRLRVERVEVLGLGDRRDVDDVGPARERDRLDRPARRSRGRSSAGTRASAARRCWCSAVG